MGNPIRSSRSRTALQIMQSDSQVTDEKQLLVLVQGLMRSYASDRTDTLSAPRDIVAMIAQYFDPREYVELHFEIDLDYEHAFEEGTETMMLTCIAEELGVTDCDVYLDGVDEFRKEDDYRVWYARFDVHILTADHEVDTLRHNFSTQELRRKIGQRSNLKAQLFIRLQEVYETDYPPILVSETEEPKTR